MSDYYSGAPPPGGYVDDPKEISLSDGDCVEIKAGEELYLVCCECGHAHRILFNRPTTMQIWAAEVKESDERYKTPA